MPSRLTPPIFPLRKADENSKFMATGLVMGYPMLEGGGDVIRNHGSWGANADLTISGATWTKRETGMSGMDFNSPSAVVSNTIMSQIVPTNWTWATWLKLDSTPIGLTPKDLFSFRTSGGNAQVRVWADTGGLWSWQKSATADDYSVLSPSYFPTSGPILVISTFAGNNLAPVQMVTNTGMRSIPTQPVSYAFFNVGQGDQARTLDGFYIGNDHAGTAPWDGTVGPFYFWDRVLTNSEVWQLWQDPYSPFRRNSSEYMAPTTMRATAGFSLNGLGKTTGPKTIIQDQNSLFIVVDDYYFYQDLPIDQFIQSEDNLITIDVSDDFIYMEIPTETLSPPFFANITIDESSTFNYVAIPTDSLVESAAPTAPVLIVDQDYTYQLTFISDLPPTGAAQGPLQIDTSTDFASVDLPTDNVTYTLT